MNVEVRYQSRNGNTKAVAELIANFFEVQAESIDKPINKKVDVLFVGGGVYMNKADKEILDFITTLDARKVGEIVAFSTAGTMTIGTRQIVEYAMRAGIKVNKNTLCLKMYMKGHSFLGLKGGKLSETQKHKVKEFAVKIMEGWN